VISHIKFLGICVSNQDRAIQFYTDKLGFTLKRDSPFENGQRWVELEIPGSQTGIVLFTPKGQEDRIGSFVHTSLACDDLEATYQAYKAKGVEFTAPPTKQFWGSFAMFKDPDGNSFVLSSETKE
jgi:predicted enzyme related to lactoylglutathione lyase